MVLANWLATYKPITDSISDEIYWSVIPDRNIVFHFYGPEFEFTSKQHNSNVQTLLSVDGSEIIVAGIHRMNREGYVITENAWSNADWDEAILVDCTSPSSISLKYENMIYDI